MTCIYLSIPTTTRRPGNDYLDGGQGYDIYRFGIGSGTDTLGRGSIRSEGDTNTVEFGSGITPDDLELLNEGGVLRINIKGTYDSLIGYADQYKFADGTLVSAAQLDAMA